MIKHKSASYDHSVFKITIDYTRTLEEMIAAGRYDYNCVNKNITKKNFPFTGKGVFNTELVLIHYNQRMSNKKVLADIESKGLKPGSLEYLLAIGEIYPNLQRKFDIYSLCSSMKYMLGRCVPCLYRGNRIGMAERGLGLNFIGYDWLEKDRFIAVSK